jgi:hypothetical protein
VLEAGIERGRDAKQTELKDKECPRCHKMNPFDAKYRNFCSLLLDSSMAEKHARIVKISDRIMDIGQENTLTIERAVQKYLGEIRTNQPASGLIPQES